MTLQEISYKDPAGFVVKQTGGFYRLVTIGYKTEFEHLISSGLYQILIDKHLMIPHREVSLGNAEGAYYKKLFPMQIDLISYPFEWTYGQWQQMIAAYIAINETALQYGMLLKDASPYNFVFLGDKCILIDTLSFSFYTDGSPWRAYRQFCEEILSPFLLMHYQDSIWGTVYRASTNGFPLSFVSRQLPYRTKFNLFCFVHIHLHAKFQKTDKKIEGSKSGFNRAKLQVLFGQIKANILFKRLPRLNNIWHNYYDNDIEHDDYINDKSAVITDWLSEIRPNVTVDLGANTGKFSFIAAGLSNQVYAVESDLYSVEKIRHEIKSKSYQNISTIIADITNPSPGLGWGNNEKTPLLQRIQCDTIMALALIHHLCFTYNIPLAFIANTVAGINSKFAIIEFIPKTDKRSQHLLKTKGDIFDKYNEDAFIQAFSQYYTLIKTHTILNTERKLFLWKRTD